MDICIKKTISAYTLGCKVNQYDTSAMLEEFISWGYDVLPFGEKTDVVLINTCTVTGTGENKSLKTIRRCSRENPNAAIIAAGCLAQRDADALMAISGVKVIVGTKKREGVAKALEKAVETGRIVNMIEGFDGAEFENAVVDSAESKTRAVLKIQEGCKNNCAYCAIPLARGPLRSRSIDSLKSEVERLSKKGFAEIVLTGIHLNSYGSGSGETMTDAVVAALISVGTGTRIRLGSLEPNTKYDEFARAVLGSGKGDRLCPQFHLSLQSGCDSVLSRMRRRYNTDIYRKAVKDLRQFFPGCAITTDIIAGFPGETEEEFKKTIAFIKEIGFAKVHAFPYSERSGTEAASMAGKVAVDIRQKRAGEIIKAAAITADDFIKSKIGQRLQVVFEEKSMEHHMGYCQYYIRCAAKEKPNSGINTFLAKSTAGGVIYGEIIREG